jgi:hypothetical protein
MVVVTRLIAPGIYNFAISGLSVISFNSCCRVLGVKPVFTSGYVGRAGTSCRAGYIHICGNTPFITYRFFNRFAIIIT